MNRDIFKCDGKVLVLNFKLLKALGGRGYSNEAIFLQQIDYWLEQNKKQDEEYIDGEYWVIYSPTKLHKNDFSLLFSIDTLKRTVKKLEDKNFLIFLEKENKKYVRLNYTEINKFFSISGEPVKTPDEPVKTSMQNIENRIMVQNAPNKDVINAREMVQNAPKENQSSAKCTEQEVQNALINGAKCTEEMVQNAPNENQSGAKCTDTEVQNALINGAKCTNEMVQNAPAIYKINNKINKIYIKYNNFIKEILDNKSVDKVNILNNHINYLFWFSEIKHDVRLVISRVLNDNTLPKTYRINTEKVDISSIRAAFELVQEKNIDYCVDKILKSKKITNFESYVIASLYNSVKVKEDKDIKTSLGYDWFGKDL